MAEKYMERYKSFCRSLASLPEAFRDAAEIPRK